MGYAMIGSEQAKEFFDILFQQEQPQKEKQLCKKPTVAQLTREQARMKLMGHAMMGSKEAKELLDLLFEYKKPDQNNDDGEQKQSA
jgi:hypothetical protein